MQGREGTNIKEEARRGKRNVVDHPRERFRTGWEPAAHAVSLGGSLILLACPGPSGTSHFRELRATSYYRRLHSYITHVRYKRERFFRNEISAARCWTRSWSATFFAMTERFFRMPLPCPPIARPFTAKSISALLSLADNARIFDGRSSILVALTPR